MHPRSRAVPQEPALPKLPGPVFNQYHQCCLQRTGPRSQKTLDSAKSMAAAEAWDAALLRDPTWVLGSVAAWMSAMPMRSRWQLPLRLQLQWQWVSALVCLPRSLRRKYRPDPNQTRYLVDPHRRIESKRCGQPSYSTHPDSQEAGVAGWE